MFWNIPEAYMRTILVLSHNKCMTWWNVLESSITCESRWRFRLYSALPWLDGGNEFTWHNRGIKKCREDLGKLYVHFNFLSPFRWLFFSQLPVFFMKVTMNGKSAWLRGWGNTEKRWGTSVQNRPSLFSCNYNSSYMQMYAAMFGWAMYEMMDSNKTQIVRAKEEKLAS